MTARVVSLRRLFHVVIHLFCRYGFCPVPVFFSPMENALLGRLRRFPDSDDKLYIREIKTPYAQNSGKINFGRKKLKIFRVENQRFAIFFEKKRKKMLLVSKKVVNLRHERTTKQCLTIKTTKP